MIVSGSGNALQGDNEAAALAEALVHASGASAFNSENNEKIYGWIESMPKNSLVYWLAESLRELNYKIVKTTE